MFPEDLFQSTLPARGATKSSYVKFSSVNHFNPRSPHGERLVKLAVSLLQRYYFNPRSPHGERRRVTLSALHLLLISIHAPRTGSDDLPLITLYIHFAYFNPRSPHGERPQGRKPSRLPPRYFNPRSPHGERLPGVCEAACGEARFQSTLPARGATGVPLPRELRRE